ncbi:MAG: zinc ABC transporter substrate-binding protein [Clostridiaceae bacterium]|nr:zinc ABC transporter substrate-binding protein [Clostridiaceae bacterium]
MRKIFCKLAILLAILISFVGCGNIDDSANNDKLKVSVSISTLSEFTEAIGGDKVDVYTVVKDNMEPHDFDFSPSDKKEIMKRKLLIYNGLGLESWVNEAVEDDSKIKLVDTSKNANVRTEDDKEDPHLWLSIKEAENQCTNIKDALIEADSDNADYYEENYNKYIKQLNNLYDEYSPKFAKVKGKTFITSHEAFGYLCREWEVTQRSINGLSNDEGEATFKTMEDLVSYCKQNDIKTIFSEGTESQKTSDTLANEVGAKVIPIYTLETKVEGKTYIEAMKENYDKILGALGA